MLLTQEVPDWPTDLTGHEIHRRHVEMVRSRRRLAGTGGSPDGPSLTGTGLLDATAIRTPVGRMSQGQQRRLHLALLLSEEPDLLLLDEVTNHLSSALVDDLTHALRQTASAVIVATHDRQLLTDLETWPHLRL